MSLLVELLNPPPVETRILDGHGRMSVTATGKAIDVINSGLDLLKREVPDIYGSAIASLRSLKVPKGFNSETFNTQLTLPADIDLEFTFVNGESTPDVVAGRIIFWSSIAQAYCKAGRGPVDIRVLPKARLLFKQHELQAFRVELSFLQKVSGDHERTETLVELISAWEQDIPQMEADPRPWEW